MNVKWARINEPTNGIKTHIRSYNRQRRPLFVLRGGITLTKKREKKQGRMQGQYIVAGG